MHWQYHALPSAQPRMRVEATNKHKSCQRVNTAGEGTSMGDLKYVYIAPRRAAAVPPRRERGCALHLSSLPALDLRPTILRAAATEGSEDTANFLASTLDSGI